MSSKTIQQVLGICICVDEYSDDIPLSDTLNVLGMAAEWTPAKHKEYLKTLFDAYRTTSAVCERCSDMEMENPIVRATHTLC